jgi:hypothetical protein
MMGDKGMNILVPGGGHQLKTNQKETGYIAWDMEELETLIGREEELSKADKEHDTDSLFKMKVLREMLTESSRDFLYRGIYKTLYEQSLIYRTSLKRRDFNKFARFDQYNRKGNKRLEIDIWGFEAVDGSKGHLFYAKPQHRDGAAAGSPKDHVPADAKAGLRSRTHSILGLKNPFSNKYDATGRLGESELAKRVKGKESVHNIYFTTLGDLLGVVMRHVSGEAIIQLGGTDSGLWNQRSADKIDEWLKGISALDEEGERLSSEEIRKRIAIQRLDPSSVLNSTRALKRGLYRGVEKENIQISAQKTLAKSQQDRLKRFRIILGVMTYKDLVSGDQKTMNLAHMPISMDYLNNFFWKKAVKSKRKFYSLQEFIIDVLNDIILKNMGRKCFGGVFTGKQKPRVSLFAAPAIKPTRGRREEKEPLTNGAFYKEPYSEASWKSLHMHEATSTNTIFPVARAQASVRSYDYMMFSIDSVASFHKELAGSRDKDREMGIPHFSFGQTAGFLKSATFNKTPIEYMGEMRLARQGSSNMINQLAGKYEMQMNMFGNNLFIPGQYVYFNPVAMGLGPTNYVKSGVKSFSNIMGLGGYHLITEVAGAISPGKFETTVKALWETGGKPSRGQ